MLTLWFSFVPTAIAQQQAEDDDEKVVASAEEFERWLREDVIDLLTDEECFIAWQVKTEEQRRAFVREFWESRNQNPPCPDNRFQIVYRAWQSYAKANFSNAKRDGASTDRGRIFVLLGPPDWVKLAWPLRGAFCGCYSSFPFEVWRYEKVVVRGLTFENLELEFIDPSMESEFRLALPPEEKAVFLREPCM